jgi:hypothetical protein
MVCVVSLVAQFFSQLISAPNRSVTQKGQSCQWVISLDPATSPCSPCYRLLVALNIVKRVGTTKRFLIKQTNEFHHTCLLPIRKMSAPVVRKHCVTYNGIINLVCQTECVQIPDRSITKSDVYKFNSFCRLLLLLLLLRLQLTEGDACICFNILFPVSFLSPS